MVKRFASLVLVLTACGAESGRAPISAAPIPAPRTFTVEYREAASIFEMLDNVSGWWRNKVDPEYRTYWESKWPITDADEKAFASYGEIRKRYYPKIAPPTGLFPPPKPKDPLAAAFYDSRTIDEALGRLSTFVAPADVATLRAFYDEFRSRASALTAEGSYADDVKALDATLAGDVTTQFVNETVRAYGEHETPHFTVLYVWWPPVDHTSASPRSDTLLLKYHPTRHAADAKAAADIAVHEFIHVVSQRRDQSAKEALSSTFEASCPPAENQKPEYVLEEPLTVAQQKLYLRLLTGREPDPAQKWYGERWSSEFAKELYPLIGERRAIDVDLMRHAARRCLALRQQ